MIQKSLCFIYRFIDMPDRSGFQIIGVHDHLRPWTPQQLAANGLLTQKFQQRSAMEGYVRDMSKKYHVDSYAIFSINEYNAMMEESHELEDFRRHVMSRQQPLIEPAELASMQKKQHEGFGGGILSKLFGNSEQQ